MDTWKWVPVNEVSNVIYEDDMYSVAVINVGEWGTYTWFIEKTCQMFMFKKIVCPQ